jgi:ferritin-like metal-binding protein YciE
MESFDELMARYGALIAWASAPGNQQAAALRQATLDEVTHADTLLNQIANSRINLQAKAT